jgi:hypothetical protein
VTVLEAGEPIKKQPKPPAIQDGMPVVYAKAVAALIECQRLDEAKVFADAAEALSVWAKIYKQNQAGRQARQLRLHAHRRMGVLAKELAPRTPIAGGGSEPGPVALLIANGLTRHQADAAHHLAKLPIAEFGTFVNQEIPPAPTSIVRRFRRLSTLTPWSLLRERPRTPFACAGYVANNDPRQVAQKLTSEERVHAAKIARDVMAWLREFEAALEVSK